MEEDIGDLKKWYRYHGILMAIAFGIVIPLSAIFSRFGVIRPKKMKVVFLGLHVISSLIAIGCIAGGLYFSIEYFPGKFYKRARRLHALTGLIAIAGVMVVSAHGIYLAVKRNKPNVWVWPHKMFGLLILIFSMFVGIMGILKYHDRTKDKRYLVYVAVYCVVVFSLTLFYFVLQCVSPYKEKKNVEIDEIDAPSAAKGEFNDESWPPEDVIFPKKKNHEGVEGAEPTEQDDSEATELPQRVKQSWSSAQRLRPSEP